jgi:hypothetical protein
MPLKPFAAFGQPRRLYPLRHALNPSCKGKTVLAS